MDNTKSQPYERYHCCFCKYFQLKGYRWGYCELLGVHVKGNLDACKVAIPPFNCQCHKQNNYQI